MDSSNGVKILQCNSMAPILNTFLLQEGNIYIADYAILEGVQANAADPDTRQYLAAPFCLLYKNSQNEILPIAIQVPIEIIL